MVENSGKQTRDSYDPLRLQLPEYVWQQHEQRLLQPQQAQAPLGVAARDFRLGQLMLPPAQRQQRPPQPLGASQQQQHVGSTAHNSPGKKERWYK